MIMNYKKRFDEIRYEENGAELWYARELMHLLDYSKWQNFEKCLLRQSCFENNGIVETILLMPVKWLFWEVAQIEVEIICLHYACYLIAENLRSS